MSPRPWRRRVAAVLACAAALALAALVAGCGARARPPVTYAWVMGRPLPPFDPDGPQDAWRWAVERLLTRGLVALDSTGAVTPDAAIGWTVSDDSLTWTFRIVPGLRFTDGSPCTSEDFARALRAGLAREDHSGRRHLLQALAGVSDGGPPGAAPAIATPDPGTLVLRLDRRERDLLLRLAVPGVTGVWRDRSARPGWGAAVGLGPYRVVSEGEGRMALARARPDPAAPDTVRIRAARGAARVRSLLRGGAADLVWPLPPGLLEEPLPAGYGLRTAPASPPRLLALVMRADLQPTVRLGARRALAHAVHHAEAPRALGPGAEPPGLLVPGVPAPVPPRLDAAEVRLWLQRGKLGRAMHATLAYDADAPWAPLAAKLQADWSREGLVVDLLPLRGRALEEENLRGRRAEVLLVEVAPPLADARSALAGWVSPPRGGPVAPFRTGWRVREFDAWTWPRVEPGPLPAATVARRFELDLVVLPLATLGHRWVEREGAPRPSPDPRWGPEVSRFLPEAGD